MAVGPPPPVIDRQMAPGPGFTPSPGPRSSPWQIVGVLLVLIGFLAFFLGAVLSPTLGVSSAFAVAPCAFFLFVIGIVLLAVSTSTRRHVLPPPPPIQQPMVPAGMQGPLELACPNCGAPPRIVDRFGIATCDYCGTRFLVR